MKLNIISIVALFNLFLMTAYLNGQILHNNVGHIPQSSQVDWTHAGLLPGTSFGAVDVYDVTWNKPQRS